jgi:hypothetical protein
MKPYYLLTLLACSHPVSAETHDAGGIDTNVADGATPPCARPDVSNTCKLTLTYDRWRRAADASAFCPDALYQDEPYTVRPPACQPTPDACAWQGEYGAHYSSLSGESIEPLALVYRDRARNLLQLTVTIDGVRCVYE